MDGGSDTPCSSTSLRRITRSTAKRYASSNRSHTNILMEQRNNSSNTAHAESTNGTRNSNRNNSANIEHSVFRQRPNDPISNLRNDMFFVSHPTANFTRSQWPNTHDHDYADRISPRLNNIRRARELYNNWGVVDINYMNHLDYVSIANQALESGFHHSHRSNRHHSHNNHSRRSRHHHNRNHYYSSDNRIRPRTRNHHVSDSDVHIIDGPPVINLQRNPPFTRSTNFASRNNSTQNLNYRYAHERTTNQLYQPIARETDYFLIDSSDDSLGDNTHHIATQNDHTNDPDSVIINSTERFIPRGANRYDNIHSTPPSAVPHFVDYPFVYPGVRFDPIEIRSLERSSEIGRNTLNDNYSTNLPYDEILLEDIGNNNAHPRARIEHFISSGRLQMHNDHQNLHLLNDMLNINNVLSLPPYNLPYDFVAFPYFRRSRTGLDSSVIERLHSTTYENCENEFKDDSCAICLEKYTPSCIILKMYPCKHIFHKSCILQWLKVDSSCPFCRSKIIEPPIVL